jgi:hypothetical protein
MATSASAIPPAVVRRASLSCLRCQYDGTRTSDRGCRLQVHRWVSAAGLATVIEAHKRGAVAVIAHGGIPIVEFVPKGPSLKLEPQSPSSSLDACGSVDHNKTGRAPDPKRTEGLGPVAASRRLQNVQLIPI